MKELEEILGYTFHDKTLLARAMTTPACRMEVPTAKDNQRLEFLGDAVFGLLAADAVFARFPDDQEGPLTVRRTHVVSGATLAGVAERIGLRKFLKRNGGAHELPPHAKVLADAMEAIMGAVWLDGGLTSARAVFKRLNLPIDEKLNAWSENPKGFVQVRAQALRPSRKPIYEMIKAEGKSHQPVVTVRVTVLGLGSAEATAISKSAAEVAAATAFAEKFFADPVS